MKEEWKVYIRGNKDKGKEVIKALTDLVGGTVSLDGSNKDCIYFIDHDGTIDFEYLSSETAQIIMDNYHELHLPEQLKPKDGEAYYYVDGSGKVFSAEWKGEDYDLDCYNFGNCFHSLEEAETMAEKIRKLLKEKN